MTSSVSDVPKSQNGLPVVQYGLRLGGIWLLGVSRKTILPSGRITECFVSVLDTYLANHSILQWRMMRVKVANSFSNTSVQAIRHQAARMFEGIQLSYLDGRIVALLQHVYVLQSSQFSVVA